MRELNVSGKDYFTFGKELKMKVREIKTMLRNDIERLERQITNQKMELRCLKDILFKIEEERTETGTGAEEETEEEEAEIEEEGAEKEGAENVLL